MKSQWHSEITNDPERDYDLYLELLENDVNVGRVQRDTDGILKLTIYKGGSVSIPVDWLLSTCTQFITEGF